MARPYKPAFPEEIVVDIMKEKVESHFGLNVYAVFERSLDTFQNARGQFTDEACAA
ncbi:MAG: hypothetical protein OJF52_002150 [Nitrospira sp.]|nr:MAG: hypothetical protein OJF52_002150 [Nitrospira sp.]